MCLSKKHTNIKTICGSKKSNRLNHAHPLYHNRHASHCPRPQRQVPEQGLYQRVNGPCMDVREGAYLGCAVFHRKTGGMVRAVCEETTTVGISSGDCREKKRKMPFERICK